MHARWRRIHAGMDEEEVRKLIVPAMPDWPITREYWLVGSIVGPPGSRTVAGGANIFEPVFPFYTLTFVNGILQRADMHW